MIGNIIAESVWELNKLGKPSASGIADLFTEPKSAEERASGELSVTAKKYLAKKASEIVTGTIRQLETFSTTWGNDYEPIVAEKIKEQYPDFEYYGKVNQVFFPWTDFSGGSPDGVCRPNRIVFEIKCPEDPANHVLYCATEDLKKAEKDYWYQIQMNMAVMAKQWGCDFMDMKGMLVSYCPLVNPPYKDFHKILVMPDAEFYTKLPVIMDKAAKYMGYLLKKMKA